MKKYLLSLFASALLYTASMAQAPLPTSWNCEGSPPTGWTANGLGLYNFSNFSCSTAPSVKFDISGNSLTLQFSSQPGKVTFSVKGQTGGSAWTGDFRLQESANGTTWTDFRVYNTSNPLDANACKVDTAYPRMTSTRYVRFMMMDTRNVELDEISVIAPVTPLATINVVEGTTQLFDNGGTSSFGSAVGTPLAYALKLENLGTTNTLTIDSVKVSGTYASEYAVTSTTPFDITSSSNANLNLSFTPTASGDRPAVLKIYSNAANIGVFTVNLNGVGGTLATEPTVQATQIRFSNVKTYRYTVGVVPNSTSAGSTGGYVILRSVGSAVSGTPADGTSYKRGSSVGNAKVVMVGNITDSVSFRPTWVQANTAYHFAVFSYNGTGTFTNYNTTSPLTGSVTTPATMMAANEYASIDTGSATFISDLTALIRPHSSTTYNNYEETMIDLFETRDTIAQVGATEFNKVVTCQYSGQQRPYNYPFDWSGYDFSREHTYCHTWMPSYPADSPEQPEYNDQHHLFPTNQSKANGPRCNYPLGEVVTATSSYLECSLGTDAAGNKVFEPRDSHKGRAARALFYMCVAYTTTAEQWNLLQNIGEMCSAGSPMTYRQDQYILKKWNYLYPPTSYEIARNDFLDSLQGNRNPFTDHPDWACKIDFYTMTKINDASPCSTDVGMDKISAIGNYISVFPNPANDKITVGILHNYQSAEIKLVDVLGKVVYSETVSSNNNMIEKTIAVDKFSKGLYNVVITIEGESLSKKITIQ